MMTHSGDPTTADFERLAQQAFGSLPSRFREQLSDVIVKVHEFATAEQLAEVGLDDRWELTGLYEGRPLPEQSVWSSGDLPPRISLFRQPLLAEWKATGVELGALIRHVVVHEAGHHFGFSDDDMAALERDD